MSLQEKHTLSYLRQYLKCRRALSLIRRYSLTFCAIMLGLPSSLLAASFECNKATTETEISICEHPNQSLPFLIESYDLIKENLSKITKLPLECISYEFEQSANSEVDWSLREIHNAQCGGDPNSSPRIAFLKTSIEQNNDDVSLSVYDTPCGCWKTLSQ